MPEGDEKFTDTHWYVGVTGREEELLVYAAYSVYDSTSPLISLCTADHKAVFQAPVLTVTYMRRADVTRKVDRNAPPNQVRDLEAGVGPLAPIKPVPFYADESGERPEPRRWQYPVGGAV
jgi:hypothetical protein